MTQTQTQNYEDCIAACMECIEASNICFSSCLKEDEINSLSECIEFNRVCSQSCSLAIQAMQLDNSFVKQICLLCSEICEACGNACKTKELEYCLECAAACFRCAEECRKIAS